MAVQKCISGKDAMMADTERKKMMSGTGVAVKKATPKKKK